MLTSQRAAVKTSYVLLWFAFNIHIAESKCRPASRCISITECAPFVQLAQNSEKPLHPSIVHFLKSQQCDFAGGYPKVCCRQVPQHLNVFMTKEGDLRSPKNESGVGFDGVKRKVEADDEKWEKKMRKFSAIVGSNFFDLVGYNYRGKRGEATRGKVEVEIR